MFLTELLGIVFSLFLFFFSLILIILYTVHYIHLLLLLEALLLSIFLFVSWSFLNSTLLLGLFMFLLVMVCMGGFSISFLVSLARFYGRDFWFFRFIF